MTYAEEKEDYGVNLKSDDSHLKNSEETPAEYTILIVDDEKSVLNALRRSLADENYNILIAENPPMAMELLSDNNIAVVISDYSMPGVSGAEFFNVVKRKNPNCIRIMLSGAADVDSVQDEIADKILNCQKFVAKPWDDDQLKLLIRESVAQYENSCKKMHNKE
jgi:response regulator RpfG family c-di-GMP phosphodiesterase